MNAVKTIQYANRKLDNNDITLGEYKKMIEPLEDVRPVVYGRWNCSDDAYETAVCSVCGWDTAEPWEYIKDRFEFCPHCGARMDERG